MSNTSLDKMPCRPSRRGSLSSSEEEKPRTNKKGVKMVKLSCRRDEGGSGMKRSRHSAPSVLLTYLDSNYNLDEEDSDDSFSCDDPTKLAKKSDSRFDPVRKSSPGTRKKQESETKRNSSNFDARDRRKASSRNWDNAIARRQSRKMTDGSREVRRTNSCPKMSRRNVKPQSTSSLGSRSSSSNSSRSLRASSSFQSRPRSFNCPRSNSLPTIGETEVLQGAKHESCDDLLGGSLHRSTSRSRRTRRKARKGDALKYRYSASNALLDTGKTSGKQNARFDNLEQKEKPQNPFDRLLSCQPKMDIAPPPRVTRKSSVEADLTSPTRRSLSPKAAAPTMPKRSTSPPKDRNGESDEQRPKDVKDVDLHVQMALRLAVSAT